MSLPTIDVGVRLGIAVTGEFIVGTSLVDGTDVIGDGLNSVASDSYAINITRGRFSQLWDAIGAGSCTASLWNSDRDYDPENVSGTYYGELVPGRLVRVTANGIDVFTGYVSDWQLEYSVEGRSTANVIATDALGMFAQAQLNAYTSTVTTVPGKLHEICDRGEVAWPIGDRDFGGDSFSTGASVVLGSNAVSWGTNALTAAQTTARSNLGYLYSSRSGVLTFRSRRTLETVGDGPVVAFADDGTGIGYQGIAASMGADVLFARVSAESAGGSAQTATVADLAAWIVDYGPVRSLSIGELQLSTDAQALLLAQELLAKYETPAYLISEITVDLTPLSTSEQNEVLALDIGAQVSVTFTPNGVGDPIIQEPYVQGIRHSIGTERHTVTFSLIIN